MKRWRAAVLTCAALALLWHGAALNAGESAPPPEPELLKIYTMESEPISFYRDVRLDGFVVELANRIQHPFAQQSPVEILPRARALAAAELGPNILLLPLVRTPERERSMTLIGPVYLSTATLYARKGESGRMRALGEAIHQRKVGVRRGSIYADLAHAQGYQVFELASSADQAVKMLMHGRFDLWLSGSETVAVMLKRAGFRPDDVEPVTALGTYEVCFGFSSGTPEATIKAWEDGLRTAKRDGSYQQLYRKWLPGFTPPPETRRYGLASAQ